MLLTTVRSVLVVAAHPDDEVLGCGGTMARLARAGASVAVAFLADGVKSRETGRPSAEPVDALARRRSAAERACSALGARVVAYHDFPDNQLDTIPVLAIAQVVEGLVDEVRPDLILTHHAGDLNVDHRQVHEAVMTACRPQPGATVHAIATFEVPSSTEWRAPGAGPAFAPNWFVDISHDLAAKRTALEAYGMEMRPWPHSRSVEAVEHLARWRGASVGVEAAEGFMLVRLVEPV